MTKAVSFSISNMELLKGQIIDEELIKQSVIEERVFERESQQNNTVDEEDLKVNLESLQIMILYWIFIILI